MIWSVWSGYQTEAAEEEAGPWKKETEAQCGVETEAVRPKIIFGGTECQRWKGVRNSKASQTMVPSFFSFSILIPVPVEMSEGDDARVLPRRGKGKGAGRKKVPFPFV